MDRGADRDRPIESGLYRDSGRKVRGEARQLRLDLVDRFDDVGAGLLVDREQNARRVVMVGCGVPVGRRGHRTADVPHPDRRAVAISNGDVLERLRLGDLIVGDEDEARLRGREAALRGVRGRANESAAHLFERQPARCELGWIDLDAKGRPLLAADGDLGDARYLRDLLRKVAVGIFADRSERQRVGMHRQDQDRRFGGVELPVGWRGWHGFR